MEKLRFLKVCSKKNIPTQAENHFVGISHEYLKLFSYIFFNYYAVAV